MRDTKYIYEIIGENIKKYRKLKGLSQESLALCGSINRSFIGHVERAERKPSIDTLIKISQTLNVPIYKFFVLTDEERNT